MILKKYRTKHKYTQEKIAEKLGISTRHWQRLENQESMPSLDLLIKIAQLLWIKNEDLADYIWEIKDLKED